MKKFSVLLVAILALMMLFVSCENEPKKRAATMKDAEIVMGLLSSVGGDLVDGKIVEEDEDTTKYDMAVFKDKKGNVAVLNGTMTEKIDPKSKTWTTSVDFGDGTEYKGVDHTLVANIVMKMPEKVEETVDYSYKIILDGVILTDFVFDLFSI